jgi:carbamate kinase
MARQLRIFSLGGNEVSPVDLKDPKTGKAIIPDIGLQWQRTADTCKMIASIIEEHPNDLYVITHGNGPQVGNILLRAEYARPILHPLPLDICGADTQGAMGYMLGQLSHELQMRGLKKIVAETVTQVVVNKKDPDFQNPSKYIGSTMTKEEALARAEKDCWSVKCYGKDKEGKEIWRRVVPSPKPISIVEIDAIEAQLLAGMIPVSVGGGGIPVSQVEPRVENGNEVYECNYGIKFQRPQKPGQKPAEVYTGVEAVIDKDLASALLGKMLIDRAKARGEELEVSLTIFTAEDGAKLNYQKPDQVDLRKLTLNEARELASRKPPVFPAGSMGPKMDACIKFLESGGKVAYITKTALFEKTLAGKAGTTLVP